MSFFESFMNRYSVLFSITFLISIIVLILSNAFVRTFSDHFKELRLKTQCPPKWQLWSFSFALMVFFISGLVVLYHLVLQGIHMFHMDFGCVI